MGCCWVGGWLLEPDTYLPRLGREGARNVPVVLMLMAIKVGDAS